MSTLDKLNEQVNKHGVGSLSSLELAAWREGEKAAAELARLRTIEEHVNEAVEKITDWKDKAYPLDIFPEPDLKRAHELLTAGGMSLDVVSASAMRHALNRVCEILAACLKGQNERIG